MAQGDHKIQISGIQLFENGIPETVSNPCVKVSGYNDQGSPIDLPDLDFPWFIIHMISIFGIILGPIRTIIGKTPVLFKSPSRHSGAIKAFPLR